MVWGRLSLFGLVARLGWRFLLREVPCASTLPSAQPPLTRSKSSLIGALWLKTLIRLATPRVLRPTLSTAVRNAVNGLLTIAIELLGLKLILAMCRVGRFRFAVVVFGLVVVPPGLGPGVRTRMILLTARGAGLRASFMNLAMFGARWIVF